ncbi:MAG: hypothetical protein K8G79_05570 [bacterium]|uniref:Uncharacterized protein n=1 Tax=Candidatus Methylomirabilis tolerans TaxID=3123416 RepID=A0AAJ1AHA4_9BACT|nr:hypothetical protein [Candidatus Methylomirabilis sp.]
MRIGIVTPHQERSGEREGILAERDKIKARPLLLGERITLQPRVNIRLWKRTFLD